MDPRERIAWQEADRLLDPLLDLPATERPAALDAATSDPQVRACLQRLLEAHDREDGPLDRIPHLVGLAPARSEELAGRRMGRWRLQEEIGRGGMAVVYRAESVEAPAGQLAAVKVLTLGALAAGGHERFLREQQLLARLRHPGVVPLYEGGLAADGTPWLAMALVDGQRIDAWCEQRGAGIDTRIDLLLQVAGALAYAHRNLVIHRDIKPSNVLVDEDGHVRLLDFGIARLADELDSECTSTAMRALTPQYAAPEQFSGGVPGTAMDVYGLGALAYCLLAGVPPHDDGGPDRRPVPPSRSRRARARRDPGAAPAWARGIDGDLDTIVLKALSERPEDRYPSVEAMAEDLQRWRQRRPIRARAPSLRYRLGRFVARHRAATVGTVALLALATASAVQIGVQQHRAREQAERATLVRDFLADVLASSDPSNGDMPDALDILDTGSRRARESLRASNPLSAADVLSITGSARTVLNDLDGAERDLREALQILEELPRPAARELASVHWSLGALYKVRGSPRSLEHFEAAAEWMRRWDAPAADRLQAESSLASIRSHYGDLESAERELRRIVAEVPVAGVAGTQVHMDALNALTSVLARRGAPLEERIALHEERVRAARQLYGVDNGWYAYTLADSVPTLRRDARYLARAEEMAREAVALTSRIYASRPHMFEAVAYCNLAALLSQRGRYQEALGPFSRALELDEALDRSDLHARSCRWGRAWVLAALGRHDEARADLADDRRMLSRLEREVSPEWMENCALEAMLLLAEGATAPAGGLLRECRATHMPAEGPRIRLADLAEAELHVARGDPAAAAPLLERLRRELPAGEVTRRWLRPWLLSLHLATAGGAGQEAARLRAQLEPLLAAEPAHACLEQGVLASACPRFP